MHEHGHVNPKVCLVTFLSILPRRPAVDPHTADLQRPLEQRKVGCRTTWPEASRAERNSQIRNLQRNKQTKKRGEVKKHQSLSQQFRLFHICRTTDTHTQKVSDKGWCLAVASETSMGSEGLHNVLCDQHFCTLRKWVFA